MSVARPARSMLGRWLAATHPTTTEAVQRRQLHGTAPRCKRRPRFRNVKAEALGLLDPARRADFLQEQFPDLTDADRTALKRKYTPAQLEAIEAGEKAVKPEDLVTQGTLRDDSYRPAYLEDFSVLDPRYDVKPDMDVKPREPQWLMPSFWADRYGMRMIELTEKKAGHQAARAMIRAFRKVKESKGADIDLTTEELDDLEKDPELLKKYLVDEPPEGFGPGDASSSSGAGGTLTRSQVDQLDKAVDEAWEEELDQAFDGEADGGEFEPTGLELREDGPAGPSQVYSAEAAELGKVPGVAGLHESPFDPEDEGQDEEGAFQEIKRVTGLKLKEIRSLVNKELVNRYVHNQTRLGKIRSTSSLAIAGNGDGWLGLGMAKSTDNDLAREMACMLAIRNMKPFRRYENRTIYGNVKAKVSGTIVELYARPPGFGLRCPHRIFEMCRTLGVHDLAVRIPRSKNPMNSVKATYQALMNQPDPEAMAVGRGRKLVDVRKVYYGGSVH